MEQSVRLLMGWKVRALEAYGLSIALIAALFDSIPLGFVGSSQTMVSAFLSFLRAKALPAGWNLIGPSAFSRIELGIIASIALAFLVCYPVAAYVGIRLITNDPSKRTLTALIAGAVALFYTGAILGSYFAKYYLIASLPGPLMLTPDVLGYDFYTFTLQEIVLWALAFTAPVYVLALTKFRRGR
jgi:hypothetical protein